MGPIGTLLSLPVAGPIGALTWLARQIAGNAMEQLLDPARIETALRRLERRLEAGEIDETTYDAEEAKLLEELAEMRALRAADTDEAAQDTEDGFLGVDPALAVATDAVPELVSHSAPGRAPDMPSGDTA